MSGEARWRKWTRLKKSALAFGVVLAAYAAFIGIRMYVMQPALIVSRETTFITEPLRPDGTPDYAAALHEEWSKGVTPENNAAVPLARAFGPAIIAPEIRERYFELIGIEPPPAEGEYFVTLDAFLREQKGDDGRRSELHDAYYEVSGGDIREKYPELEAWVKANQEPLERIVAASRCSHFYSPILTSSPTADLVMGQLATHATCREAARLLRIRGEIHLDSGELDAACDDAISLHRLGRLVGESSALIGNMVGISIDMLGTRLSERIVLSMHLDTRQSGMFAHRIASLVPFPDLVRTVDHGERFVVLDTMSKIVRRARQDEMRYYIRGFRLPVPKLDPNVTLCAINVAYDSRINALRITDPSRRQQRFDQLDESVSHDVRDSSHRGANLVAILTGNRSALTRRLSLPLCAEMVLAIADANKTQEANRQREQLEKLGVAFANHQAQSGAFPFNLRELSPDEVRDIPTDDLWGHPLQYRRIGEGFLLYSFGPNGKDDSGRNSDDCDDIRFGRVPSTEETEQP